MSNQTQAAPMCCGTPMAGKKYFARDIPGTGVIVWTCFCCPAHPEVYESIETGERIGETK